MKKDAYELCSVPQPWPKIAAYEDKNASAAKAIYQWH